MLFVFLSFVTYLKSIPSICRKDVTGDLHITLEEVNIIHLIHVPEGNS